MPTKWVYKYPVVYDWLDTVINLGLSNRARAKVVSSLTGKLLEVGIGSGKSFKYFRGEEFYGVDIQFSMLKCAKRCISNLCVASAHNLPFKAQSFNKVLFIYTLRVLNTPVIALDEAFRVGKEVIVLEFKPVSKLFELFGKKVFGSSNLSTEILRGFTHRSYLNQFDIYYRGQL